MLHDTYLKCVKMSVYLIHNMVPPVLEQVLDMAQDGDKEYVHIYMCVCVNYDTIFVPTVVTNRSPKLREFRSCPLAAGGGFRQCLRGG